MKKIYLIIPLFLAVLSCSEDTFGDIEDNVSEKKVDSFIDYYKFLTNETDGSVLVQSISTLNSDPVFSATSTIPGNHSSYSLNTKTTVIQFNNFMYDEESGKSTSVISNANLKDFFGKIQSFNLGDGMAKGEDEGKIYIPEVISASFSGLNNGRIVAGTTISWNVDGNNENGVVIGFEYNPYAQSAQSIQIDQPEHVWKGVTLPDQGSYVITEEDMENIPNDATVTFYVARAGYIITTDGDEDYSLAGLTVSRADFAISKP